MAIVLVPKDSLPVSRIWRGNVYVPDNEGTDELPQDLLDTLEEPADIADETPRQHVVAATGEFVPEDQRADWQHAMKMKELTKPKAKK